MQWLLKRILGTKNERDLKKLRPFVARINALEKELQGLTDEALKALLLNGQDVTALTGVIRASHALNDYSDLSKYRYLAAAMRALLAAVG